MRIDDMIKKLQEYREEYGNLEIFNIVSGEEVMGVTCEVFDDEAGIYVYVE